MAEAPRQAQGTAKSMFLGDLPRFYPNSMQKGGLRSNFAC
jgi:hypothetical protein